MLGKLIARIFGTKHERDIKRIRPAVDKINRVAHSYRLLSDGELRGKTQEFRERVARDETLDDLLPEAFAAVKEACRRLSGKTWKVCGVDTVWEMVPFDVQLIGGVVLHEGRIAEMATGEGKTLVATMPLYLNALAGGGAHLITVNDYLARRDSEWMGKIYEFLGLSVGCIQHDMTPEVRRLQYAADITYGTNNEFGFDYLRDNMAVRTEDRVQRGHHYTIVDEVDSVLVDEARTPLIISGPVGHASDQKFSKLKPMVERLVKKQMLLVSEILSEAETFLKEGNDYEAGVRLLQVQRAAPKNKRFMKILQQSGTKKLITSVEADFMRERRLPSLDEDLYFSIDEKANITGLSEKGSDFLSPGEKQLFVLPDLSIGLKEIDDNEAIGAEEKARRREELHRLYAERSDTVHSLNQLLKAYSLFERDVGYVVQEGKVVIVDEFTGRLMAGRRFSDGLHQALEAKEGVTVERETQTFATITLQNYFRMYDKLAGMTGTAETEAGELWQIYKLDVVVIPTNEPVRRVDYEDVIYRTKREKYNAAVEEIARCHEQGRPVLVGTVTVEVSEVLSRMLKRRKIPHSVLNAKHHQQEAQIVVMAGQRGSVTIATNMAGRGTDIKLGPGVVACDNCCLLCETLDCEHCDHEPLECAGAVPCGLHIIGTERHESRRIDRQLRGRSGRQGDPGSSR
ncbi:MAG: preprotein translocase subunit SecA, partial [Candidatus Eisenbacteria sp.]|nr:preprotein translocase subunit SecA [Candidatus Eisenbacteria bacterium]